MYLFELSCDECHSCYCVETVAPDPRSFQCEVCDSKLTHLSQCYPSPAEAKAAIDGAAEADLRAIRTICRVFGPGVREVTPV
jgi:hypothetical protein